MHKNDTADIVRLFNHSVLSENMWVIMVSRMTNASESLLSGWFKGKLEINSQVFFVTEDLTRLAECYSTGSKTVVQPVPLHTEENYIWDRRADLRGNPFQVGYAVYLPDTYEVECNGDGVCVAGLAIEILHLLKARLNFTFSLVQPKDNKYGGLDANGTWNGFIGYIVRGATDFATMRTTVTKERSQAVSFAGPMDFSIARLYMKNPSQHINIFTYAKVFDEKFFLAFFAIGILFAIGLCFIYQKAAFY